MKAFANIIWALIVLGIIIFAGSYFVGFANIFPASVVVGGQTCDVKEGESVCPLVAYYKCDPASGGEKVSYLFFDGSAELPWWQSFKYEEFCCDAYTESCRFSVGTAPFDILHGEAVQYMIPGCNPSITSTSCIWQWMTKYSSVLVDRTECITLLLRRGMYNINNRYLPFTMWSYSPSGGAVEVFKNQWGCNLPGKTSPGTGYVTDCKDAPNCNPSYVYTNKQFLNFYEAVNYVDLWVNCPVDLNYKLMANFLLYGNVYCAGDGHIYSIGSTMINNHCYAFPKTEIGKVNCCPGSYGYCANNVACGSDGKCPTVPTPVQCFSDFQCFSQGVWILNPSNQMQSIRGYCSSGECKVETKAITIACTGTQRLQIDPQTGFATCIESGPPPIPPSPTPVPGTCDLICWLINILTAFILGGIITFIIYILDRFTPLKFITRRIKVIKKLKSPKYFLISSIVIGLIILLFYGSAILTARAMLFGG